MLKSRLFVIPFLLFFTTNFFAQEICPPENLNVLPGDGQNIVMWDEPIDPFTISFNIWLGTDSWPGETSWDLLYVDTGEIVASVAEGELTEGGSEYTWDYELAHGDYVFTIHDSWGDGIYDPGGYILTLGGNEIANSIGWSGTEEIVEFSTTGRFQVSSVTFTNPLPFEKGENVDISFINNWPTNAPVIIESGQIEIPLTRDVPEVCGDFSYYQVYDGDGNALGTTTDLEFAHDGLTNGTEVCYTVTAVYAEGESVASNSGCATPADWTAEPATNLMSFPGDEQIILSWLPPGGGGGGGTQGDNMDNPFIVTGVPFTDNGTTEGFTDDYDEECPYTGSESNDVVYLFSTSGGTYDFSICESGYDTKLYIYDGDGNVVDCNDDACNNAAGDLFRSLLEGIELGSGIYYVIVDGYGSQNGEYQLDITMTGGRSYDYCTLNKEDDFTPTPNTEYDFLGYNVYVDGSQVNSDILVSSTYSVTGLSNEVSYELGVTAVYEGDPNYESVMITATDAPVYLFGDISGTIVDPNGAPLDSVAVSASGITDTTGTDGTFTLWNLVPGTHNVTARRAGFYASDAEATVVAQADPTVLDFTLAPDMPNPGGLAAYPGDHEVDLMWRTPGGMQLYELGYDDGTYETSITGGSTEIELAVYFSPNVAGELLSARILFTDIDGFGYAMEPVEVRVYTTSETEPPSLVYTGEELMQVTEFDAWLDYDLTDVVPFDEGGFLLGFRFTSDAGPGIARDSDGYVYGHSFVSFGDGEWIETGDLGFPGNYMIRAIAALDGEPEGRSERQMAIMSGGNAVQSLIEYENANDFTYSENNVVVTPSPLSNNVSRDDELVEYNVYEVSGDEPSLVATTVDTFATIVVDANYETYCYNVKAVWNTDSYGVLESKASNTSCTVPYTMGDADFDSDVDVSDLLSVVDFILELTAPSEDQFRNCDVNMDEEINIADVVMMVDIMYGRNDGARIAGFDPNSVAFVELMSDYSESRLWLNVDYDNLVRGAQFEIEYNPTLISIQSPQLSFVQENVIVTSSEKTPGTISVVIANLVGGSIEKADDALLYFPIEFHGNKSDVANIELDKVGIADVVGNMVTTVSRSTSVDFKLIPGSFALHQNYPNPFNPKTEIQFDLPENGIVEVAIYNLMGQKINTLISGELAPGFHKIEWNGKDLNGQSVSSGMYFYSFTSKGFKSTRKMLLLK
ncbi:MAG: carboxypeptidase regulatory-like domain-containing protein [Candidatus Marinimicrobia bacterium]|nr:carboxypeptidase regulatory-like domain-containing protein [Candidatus Neomarinimicrobiota bacterium]